MLLPALTTTLFALAQDPAPSDPPPAEGDPATAPQQEPGGNPWAAPPPRTAAQVRAEEESEALAAIERELFNSWFRREPWAARELGYANFDHLDGEFEKVDAVRWATLLDRCRGDLVSIRAGQLAPDRLADYDWLRAWVETEALLLRLLPRAENDPAWFVERVHRSVHALADADTPDGVVRLAHLARRLAGVPEIWETARATLVAPDQAFAEYGAERTLDLLLDLDRLTDWATPMLWTRDQRAAFFGPRDLARDATREFATWLDVQRDLREAGVWRISSRSWEGLLRAHTGTELSVEELKVLLLSDLAGFDLAMGESAPLAVLDESLSPEDAAQHVRHGMVAAATAGLSARFVPPDPVRPGVRAAPSAMRGGPLAALRVTGPQRLMLEVAMDAPHWRPEMGATRRSLLSPAGLMALGVRYGPAGEALLLAAPRDQGGLTRRFLPNPGTIGAFGLWATEWSTRLDWGENPILEDAELSAELVRQRALEAARVFAAMRLHGDRREFEEIVTDLVRLVRLDRETARREVFEAMRNPLHGSVYVSFLELRRVEQALRREFDVDEAEALRMLGLAVRLHPHARPVDLLRVIERERARIGKEAQEEDPDDSSDR